MQSLVFFALVSAFSKLKTELSPCKRTDNVCNVPSLRVSFYKLVLL